MGEQPIAKVAVTRGTKKCLPILSLLPRVPYYAAAPDTANSLTSCSEAGSREGSWRLLGSKHSCSTTVGRDLQGKGKEGGQLQMLDRRLAMWLWHSIQKSAVLAVEWTRLLSSFHLGSQLQLCSPGAQVNGNRNRRAQSCRSDPCRVLWWSPPTSSKACPLAWLFLLLVVYFRCTGRLACLLGLVTRVMLLWKFIQYQHGLWTWHEPGLMGFRSTLSQQAKEIPFEEQERSLYLKWTKIGHCEAAVGWTHGFDFSLLQFV